MTNHPAVNELEAIDTIVHWIDLIAEAMTSDASRLTLRTHIRQMIRSGTIPTMQVIEAARHGHADASYALRELGAEMLKRGEMPPPALSAYLQEALVQSPISYPPGRNLADTWLRDIGIAVLVYLAVERWRPHLEATRNEATVQPSACSLVSAALSRRGHKIGERRVEKIFGSHSKLANRLSASIPSI